MIYIVGMIDHMTNNLESIIDDLFSIGVTIRNLIPEYTDGSVGTNVYGDSQKKLDIMANELFIEKFTNHRYVGKLASEEMDNIIEKGSGSYMLTFDPLDGSSNIDTNNLFGTIVAIFNGNYKNIKNLEASMYLLYGPSLTSVVAYNNNVDEYIYNPNKKEWHIRKSGLKLQKKNWVYGIGGIKKEWPDWLKSFEHEHLEGFKQRYGGALVGDFNQLLHYGGFFAYPELNGKPNGKYRAYFESIPIALITEYADGFAVDGINHLLKREYSSIMDVIPSYFGNLELLDTMMKYRNG